MTSTDEVEIHVEADLDELIGQPVPRVRDKVRRVLGPLDMQWLAAAPFCLVGTSAADGTCDVSPKGDPAGIALVLDAHTIAIPERPGNRRVDGYRNILSNPHVGLVFVIPGRGDTLRVNGRARLVRDAPFFDRMLVQGHRPALALVVDVEEVFFHCSKAFARAALWEPETWQPDAVPSRAEIAHRLERPDERFEAVEAYYGRRYLDQLY
jgi:uncharacterized protein